MTQAVDILLALLRQDATIRLDEVTADQWKAIIDLAFEQGVDAISVDGYHSCLDAGAEDCLLETDEELEDLKFEWFGSVLQAEEDSRRQKETISALAKIYADNGLKMMLLKGYGLSLNWPVPEHRPTGDIDIYLFGDWKRADEVMAARGITIDNSHHHHSVFQFGGMTVENHYDFINAKSQKSNAALEARLKELSGRGEEEKDAEMENVWYPSVQFNALFLARHCAAHFSSTEMTLRQLLDWLLFVKANHDRIDWSVLYSDLRRFNLHRFVNSLNAIGVRYLGFDARLFHEVSTDDALTDRILSDILSPEFKEKEDGTLLSGLWVKPRRWWHNRWKHAITSPDPLWSSFLHGLWAKLLKPAHFRE